MDLMMKDRVALVTGAARGLGKAIALGLAAEGVHVAVSDLDLAGAQQTAAEVEALGCQAMAIKCNVAVAAEVEAMVQQVLDRFGRLEILVNNAGIFPHTFIEDMTEADWDKVLGINLKGVAFCSKAVIPAMKKQRYGKILNASSIVYRYPDPGIAGYSATKAAVSNFTQCLAGELAPWGVNVNAFAPGIVATPMTAEVMAAGGDDLIRQRIPLGRWGKPEDVAHTVVFLASDKANYITGITVEITGGLFIIWNPEGAHR